MKYLNNLVLYNSHTIVKRPSDITPASTENWVTTYCEL